MATVRDLEVEALLGFTPAHARSDSAFDGASRMDQDMMLWHPALRSADADLLPEKPLIDARVHDIARNDAYVQSGTQIQRDGIVGSQYMLNAKPAHKVLGLDETWAEEFAEEVEAKFSLWAESAACWPDAARQNTLTGLVRLGVSVYSLGGEIVGTAEWLRDDPRPYRSALQLVEGVRLETPPEQAHDPNVRAGIRYDRYGAPQAYFFRMAHPSDYNDPDILKFREVPARKPWGRPQVLHAFEQTRIDQSRGVSDLVAALKEMRTTKKFREVTLQNAVVNAIYAASVESELPTDVVAAQLGGRGVGDGITNYATQFLGAVSKYLGKSKGIRLDGVKIPHLFPGTKLQLRPAGQPGGVGQEFEASLIRYIAACLGVSYEELSRDFTNANYSTVKAAMVQTWRFMQGRKRAVADCVANFIYRLWLEEAMNKGEISTISAKQPNWYDAMNADAYCACDWIGASRGQIDELKETQAAVLRIANNLSTYQDELARLGKDWRKVVVQREREEKELKKRGLQVQPDSNMMNAVSGDTRNKNPDGGKDGNKGGGKGGNKAESIEDQS